MKMDAMQKRRMWKVAIAHFVLTVVCIFAPYFVPHFFQTAIAWSGPRGEAYNRALQHQAINMAHVEFASDCGMVLQPQFFVFAKIIKPPVGTFVFLLLMMTVPVWSICFGWIYVKFTNWLNHFPVLGKKVF
jgi:hypothetical protein